MYSSGTVEEVGMVGRDRDLMIEVEDFNKFTYFNPSAVLTVQRQLDEIKECVDRAGNKKLQSVCRSMEDLANIYMISYRKLGPTEYTNLKQAVLSDSYISKVQELLKRYEFARNSILDLAVDRRQYFGSKDVLAREQSKFNRLIKQKNASYEHSNKVESLRYVLNQYEGCRTYGTLL